jgi:hypothetical protein
MRPLYLKARPYLVYLLALSLLIVACHYIFHIPWLDGAAVLSGVAIGTFATRYTIRLMRDVNAK